MKKISVIVPVYNAEKWVDETLNSLVNQTYKNIEIICIDDGSSDNSCDIIEQKQKDYSNIKLIRQENSGVCAARNRGIDEAAGEYIAFVDSDDYVELDMYENMIRQMEDEESDIVFCEIVRFWPNGKIQYTQETSFTKLVENPKDIKYFLYSTTSRTEGNTLYTEDIHGSICRSVFKKEIIEKQQLKLHTNLKFAEDQIFMLEYLAHVDKISYTKKPYVWYRGATKAWCYHNLYDNNMNLCRYQKQIVNANTYYSDKQKKEIIGYLECSTYFMIINEEYMFKLDVANVMKKYMKDKEFANLLTVYSFMQKYKVRRDPKRIVLFVLLKLHMWDVVKHFYPNKKY